MSPDTAKAKHPHQLVEQRPVAAIERTKRTRLNQQGGKQGIAWTGAASARCYYRPYNSNQFATYTPVANIKDNIVLNASKDVKLKPFQPDITNINGVWTVTEKGAAAASHWTR